MRDHGFHTVRVKQVVRETAEASSFVLDVPEELRADFAYRPGQFVTFRVMLDGQRLLRSYSMSSAPEIDPDMQVTVKRVPGGVVSNWMNDALEAGDSVEVTLPAGVFCLAPGGGDVVAFGAGSGITPLLSIIKSALASTDRRVRLFYANADRERVIFACQLDDLARRYAGRLEVCHHLDSERGFATADDVRRFADASAEHFICGPGPFMDIVETALLAEGVSADSIRIERFSVEAPVVGETSGATPARVTVQLDGRTATGDHRPGTTILQTARQLGLAPPFSCEAGNCATCMARLVEGEVTMRVNNALTEEEVEEGWVLTCQSVPASPLVRVVYEDG